VKKLTTSLRCDLWVRVDFEQRQQRVLLLCGNILLVSEWLAQAKGWRSEWLAQAKGWSTDEAEKIAERKGSGEKHMAHRWTKTSRHWCQSTGRVRRSDWKRTKWNTMASITRNGSAYFLSSRTRRKMLFAPKISAYALKRGTPLYGISAILSMAAADCSAGMLVRARALLMITASRMVQSPACRVRGSLTGADMNHKTKHLKKTAK
jgi:hypothetical protein